MSDRLVGLLMLVVSLFFYVQTYFFKRPTFAQFEQMGPEFLPRGILIGLAVLSLALVIVGKGSLLPTWNVGSVRALFGRYRDAVATLLLFPIYAVALQLVGFLISTVVFLIVMQLVLKPRRDISILYVVVGSFVFTWGVFTLFQGYLNVLLPAGSLF